MKENESYKAVEMTAEPTDITILDYDATNDNFLVVQHKPNERGDVAPDYSQIIVVPGSKIDALGLPSEKEINQRLYHR